MREFVGGDPVLSKLGMVIKEKTNPKTGKVTRKVRLILDNKESKVFLSAARTHRSTLPRPAHVISDTLSFMQDVKLDHWRLRFLIADIKDAFWLIPLAPEERRFFVCKH